MSEALRAGMELALARAQSSELAEEMREEAAGRVRRSLREEFESEAVRAVFERGGDPLPALMDLLAPHRAAGAEDVFDAVVGELAAEAAALKKLPPSLYLVDHSTGRALIPFRPGMVYQPPDYVGEDGVRRRATPVLHPGIAAPLTEMAHEAGKKRETLALAGPGVHTEHLSDPQSIVRHARERLAKAGYEDAGPLDGPAEETRVGLESALSDGHSRMVWRAQMYGAKLASRIAAAAEAKGTKRFQIGEAVQERDSRHVWYSVTYRAV